MSSRVWQVRIIPPPHKNSRIASRRVKILTHLYLPEYQESVYHDGNLVVTGDVNELFDRYLLDSDVAMFHHGNTAMDPVRTVREEAAHLIERTKRGKYEDDADLIEKQLRAYLDDGFPDTFGLSVNMVLLRRHHTPHVVHAMERWWGELLRWSQRDQMSFNYVAWKTGLKFNYIDGDSRDNKYFQWVPHEDISYLTRKWNKFKKLFR